MTNPDKGLRIAVASGKGGTGKTTVSVNLALLYGQPVTLLDCDVEEPNCSLFLKGTSGSVEPVKVQVPEISVEKCTACGACSDFCEYNALAVPGRTAMLFPELCHSCGGCEKVCTFGAIREVPREVGQLRFKQYQNITFVDGLLNIGEAIAGAVIRAVKEYGSSNALTILDAPPGTSCPVIETVSDCDYVVLVTEPTPFGFNDLKLAVETMRVLGIPFGVVINRCDIGDDAVANYCREENIPLLGEIPNLRQAAEAYSRGQAIALVIPELRSKFLAMLDQILSQARQVGRAR